MRQEVARLPETARHFSGYSLDRERSIEFRLNGRLYAGYQGDTVLSALLASGVSTIGVFKESPIALGWRSAPMIAPSGTGMTQKRWLPMARTLAKHGADYETADYVASNRLKRLFQSGDTLGLDLNRPQALAQHWRRCAPEERLRFDLVVVGGGVAGLAAALEGAKHGVRTLLIERHFTLGGYSGLFGAQEHESSPEAHVEQLRQAVTAAEGITIMTGSEAIALRQGRLRIHQAGGGDDPARMLDVVCKRVVLATGALERVPLFSGNRLPHVIGTLEAYEMAARFGVWHGQTALIATCCNPAYRLAMKAADAGIGIDKIIEARPGPASRFIAFSRAYGMVQFSGTEVAKAQPQERKLSVSLVGRDDLISTERLIVSGGWQAELTLWLDAGGESVWSAESHRLEARGALDGVALAGSAAGYFSRSAAVSSGRAAVAHLLKRPGKPVVDKIIEAIYETPDGALSVSDQDIRHPIFLDQGESLVTRPKARRRGWFGRKGAVPADGFGAGLAGVGLNDVLGAVASGLVDTAAAASLAQQRAPFVSLGLETAAPVAAHSVLPDERAVPPYLVGRFGNDQKLMALEIDEQRQIASGTLIFRNSDPTKAEHAIGVVLRHGESGLYALLQARAVRIGLPVSIHEQGQIIPARIIKKRLD